MQKTRHIDCRRIANFPLPPTADRCKIEIDYVDGKTAEGEFTQDIAAEVERIKQHNETRVEYMTLMMELKEQRREGYDEGINEGRVDNIVNNVRALISEMGWSADRAFDVLHVSPEDRAVVIARL